MYSRVSYFYKVTILFHLFVQITRNSLSLLNSILTGGRFCCNDSTQTEVLSNPIITHANHALILFRTFQGMDTGFSIQASVGE